jgi:hypothetical protein
MSTEDQLQRARELIKSKRYDDARKLLWKIDHPKAKQWLERIDGISPVKQSGAVASKSSGGWTSGRIIKVAVVAIIVGAIAFVVIGGMQAYEVGMARARISIACIERRVRLGISTDDCFSSWEDRWDIWGDEILACHRLSPELDAPFERCLDDEGISP